MGLCNGADDRGAGSTITFPRRRVEESTDRDSTRRLVVCFPDREPLRKLKSLFVNFTVRASTLWLAVIERAANITGS
jgi:hypothetical protein